MSAPQRRRHIHWYDARPKSPDLFTLPSVPVDTSEAAAEHIKPSAPSIRDAIFTLIREAGDRGMTAGELEAVGYHGSTCRPRIRELQGNASWAKGRLPARIVKTPAQRGGMRIYVAL
jgi:hypothetical protein